MHNNEHNNEIINRYISEYVSARIYTQHKCTYKYMVYDHRSKCSKLLIVVEARYFSTLMIVCSLFCIFIIQKDKRKEFICCSGKKGII